MFGRLKKIIEKIRKLNFSIDKYKKDTIIQSLPSLAFVNRAKKCIEKKDYKEAERILNEALELPQDDALVYKYLGIVAERTGRPDDALAAFRKSSVLNGQDKEIWRMLGFSYINSNLCEDAEKAFENANKIVPSNTDTFTGWGMALMKQKRFSEAHEKFVEAAKINKYNFMAILLAAIMEVRLEQYDDAEAKLNFLANVSPNESNTYEYANLKYIRGDYKSAVHYAKKALDFNANMLPVYLLLGRIYTVRREKAEALTAYEEAFKRDLITPNLFYEWGISLQKFEEFEQAKEKFEKVLELAPDEEEAVAGKALCEAMTADVQEAGKVLVPLLEKNPDCYPALKGMAFVKFKTGCFEEAIEEFKSVLKLDSTDVSVYFYIAEAYVKLSNDSMAREYFEHSLKDNPKHLKSYAVYANYLIEKGDYQEAQRKLRRALKVDENNIDLLNLLFHVSYVLVKDNVCEYNVKEALSIAEKIYSIDENAFQYAEEKNNLEKLINS